MFTKTQRRETMPHKLIQRCIPRLKRLADDLEHAARKQIEGTAEASESFELSRKLKAFIEAYRGK